MAPEEEVAHHPADEVDGHTLGVRDPAGCGEQALHPGRGVLTQLACDLLAHRTGAGHPMVESRSCCVLVFEESAEELHAGDDSGGAAGVLHYDETERPFDEKITEIVERGRRRNRGELGLHHGSYRTLRHPMTDRAVEDLAGDQTHQLAGSGIPHRKRVDAELIDAILGLFDRVGIVDREDGAPRDVDGGGRRRHLDGEDIQELLAHLDRHRAGDAGRGRGRVAAAAESLCDPADMKSGEA